MMRRAWLAAVSLAAVVGSAAGQQLQEFLPAGPDSKIPKRAEQRCPLRFEIPLSNWLASKSKAPWVVARTRLMAECNGATLQSVTITRQLSASWRKDGITVAPRVYLAEGADQRIGIQVSIFADGTEVSARADSLPGDAGESNWGDPLYLAIPPDATAPSLRIEVTFTPR